MDVKAQLRFTRMSPKKIRLVANLIKGMPVQTALQQLSVVQKAASRPVEKLLRSAIANAEHNFGLAQDNLFVREITSDLAGMLKRYTPKAHGRATVIRKRMAHVVITLGEIKPSTPKKIEAKKSPVTTVTEHPHEREPERIEPAKKEAIPAGHEQAEGVEIHDVRMEGKHRHNQHTDKKSQKGKKGFVTKMFNRKSG